MALGLFELLTLLILLFIIIFFIVSLFLIKTTKAYPIVQRSEKEKLFLDNKTEKSFPFPSLNEPWSVHLSIIIPAFDEAKRLPPMLNDCLDFLEKRCKHNHNFTYEILIVSDGSRDNTVKVASEYSKKFSSDLIRVLELETNRGKGGAVRLGMQSARGAVLLFADADGATKFSDLSKLEEELVKLTKYDYTTEPERVSDKDGLVCGSRAHLEGSAAVAERSFFRNLLMHMFHALVRTTAVASVRDTQCGFKLMTRSTARVLFSSLHVQKWAFDVELLYIAERMKIPISEVAVNWTEIEGSKIVPLLSGIQMGRDLILLWLRYKIGAWKIAAEAP